MEHGKIAKRSAPGVALRRVISSKQSFFDWCPHRRRAGFGISRMAALPDAYISRADLARQSLDPRSRGTQFRARYQYVCSIPADARCVFRTISIMNNRKAYFEQNLANVASNQKCMYLKIKDFHS
jgi:hypothetical protein